MSPLLYLHSQNDKVPFLDPRHLPKLWDKKPTRTTNKKLYSLEASDAKADIAKENFLLYFVVIRLKEIKTWSFSHLDFPSVSS